MANVLYPLCKQSFLDQNPSIDWDTDDIKVALVRGYTYSAAHQFLSDITGGGGGTIVATSANLGIKSTTNGVADAADITFTAVSAGAACENLICYKDTTVAATSPLIFSIDTATGLPVTPTGGDVTVQWSGGADKIFSL
jgi:hypothetical protein